MAKIKTNPVENETATANAEATTPATEPVKELNFLDVMGDRPQPTLRAIAEVFGVPQQRIYSVAKQPVAGQVYDAKVYNWGAISKFISKRIGKEGDEFATMEDVYNAAMAKDEELGASDKRRGSRTGGTGSSKVMIDLGDGKEMPARRKEIAVGDHISLKRYEGVDFEVVYLTDTHVVLQVVGKTVLNCLSNWTFNQQLVTDSKSAAKVEATAPATDNE